MTLLMGLSLIQKRDRKLRSCGLLIEFLWVLHRIPVLVNECEFGDGSAQVLVEGPQVSEVARMFHAACSLAKSCMEPLGEVLADVGRSIGSVLYELIDRVAVAAVSRTDFRHRAL